MKVKAFTLIELLIVVLIIAILAAIAVPNFLEFQTRAKVSRAKSDMRSLGVALEAYAVDNSDYPIARLHWHPFSARLMPLTTPISYISTIPPDPFKLLDLDDPIYDTYDYYDDGSQLYIGQPSGSDRTLFNRKWRLASPGPDNVRDFTGDVIYDPTNGTTSYGDVVYVQGDGFSPIPPIGWRNP